MNNSPLKNKPQNFLKEFNRDSPYRQRLGRKKTLVGRKFLVSYQKQIGTMRNGSKGNSNQRQNVLEKKSNQNFFINGNRINPIFKSSLSRNKNVQDTHRQNIKENYVNDVQQKRFQIRCVNNEKCQNSVNNFQIKSQKEKNVQQKLLHRNLKFRAQLKSISNKHQENEEKHIKLNDVDDYILYSKNIQIEEFQKIWENFKTAKLSINQDNEELQLQYDEDQFYAVLLNQECDNIEKLIPSGIVIYNYDYKNLRLNQIVITHLYLLQETSQNIVKFLDLISQKIFAQENFQTHEIVYRIEHQKIEDQLVPPDKEFIKNLKMNQWRWKMVLNLHEKRYTVMYKKNVNKNQDLIFSVNMNFFIFASQQNNMLSFGKQQQRPLQIYDTFENYIQNKIDKQIQNCELLPVYKQKTLSNKIQNDQDLKNYIQEIDKNLYSKDKNLKNLCFQNEEDQESLLYHFNHILRIHPNTTRKEIINNKQTKISRLPYIYKKQNEQFYFINTLDPTIKVIVIKYQQKYKNEKQFQDTIENACNELAKIQTRTNEFSTVGYLWLPNFQIQQELTKIENSMNFKKCFIEFNQILPINKIMISPDPSDKRLKGEFIFGICQANLNIGKFQPLTFFKVTRKNFIN